MTNCKDLIDNLSILLHNGKTYMEFAEEDLMNKEIKIDLKRCIKAILRKIWLIIIVGVIFFILAYLLSENSSRQDEFTAEATIYTASDYSVLTLYSDIITSTKVSDQAASILNMSNISADDIKKMISFKTYSLVLGIHATSTDEEHAIRVANAVATAFIDEVNIIASSNLAHMLDEATTVELTYNKSLEQLKFRIIVTFIGILLPSVLIILKEIFSKKVYNLSDTGLDGEINIIGVIPRFKKK